MTKAKGIFVGGTSSHSGKSWTATAICRYLKRRGFRVAPFKAQNMSNNSYPCVGGGEIGRAQVAQAEACELEAETDMNPILLKPTSSAGSQVVLHGRVWRHLPAREYYQHYDFLLGEVLGAYNRLAKRFDYIVLEGAGSVSEINLRSRDLVNMPLAVKLDVPALLVADIDRGGVFAAVTGSYALLEPAERKLMRSFLVNRFRGDRTLFADGVEILEQKTGSRCLGVMPMLDGTTIDAEDAVSLDEAASAARHPAIAVIRLPHISNFTDFRLIGPRWLSAPVDARFQWIILPGTKNTIGDLQWLRRSGLADWIVEQHRAGAKVLGICGGYQMMGTLVKDPLRLEGEVAEATGLGLLPVETELAPEKVVRRVNARLADGTAFSAYEIHAGLSAGRGTAFATLDDGAPDGLIGNRCYGTYLHGALEHPAVVERLLEVSPLALASKTESYDRLADWFTTNANIPLFEDLYL